MLCEKKLQQVGTGSAAGAEGTLTTSMWGYNWDITIKWECTCGIIRVIYLCVKWVNEGRIDVGNGAGMVSSFSPTIWRKGMAKQTVGIMFERFVVIGVK